jgi:protein farnesyltransferase/geranylgeranyltransferase type-1 subunit alpha
MDSFSEDNPKNYQIWYHRRAVVELIGNADLEKNFCDRVFSVDAKNYHAWAHRYVFAFECI